MGCVEDQTPVDHGQQARRWPRRNIAWVVLVVAFATYWPLRAEYLYDTDSVNFALGSENYDPLHDRPHSPGYPVWILMVRCLTPVVGTPNTAMILLSIAFTVVAAICLCDLASRLRGPWGAVFIVGLFLLTPNVVLYSAVATTYTADLCISSVIGYLAARLWEGDKRLAPWAAGILGLLAGVRVSGALFMTPLLACACWVACGADFRSWLKSALCFAAAVSAWFFPAAYLSHGVAVFGRLHYSLAGHLTRSCAFSRTPAEPPADRVVHVMIWFGISLVVPSCLLLCTWLLRKCTGRSQPAVVSWPVWHRWPFYTVWLLPNVVVVFLCFCPYSCYINLSLPPLILLLGNLLQANACALGKGAGGKRLWPCAVTLGCCLSASVVLAGFPFHKLSAPGFSRFRDVVHCASVQSIKESDRSLGELIALTKGDQRCPSRHMLVCIEGRRFAPNWAKVGYYIREHPVCAFEEERVLEFRAFEEPRILSQVPCQTRKIWWILQRDASASWIRAAFPDTRPVLQGRFTSFYCTDIGFETFDVKLQQGENAYSLRRDAAVELGPGFSHLETDAAGNEFLWALGPECRTRIGLGRAMPIRVFLDVFNSPIPSQEIKASFNGRPAKVLPSPAPGARVPLAFEGIKGTNELRLVFGIWNGAGSDFAPEDERPLALCFRQITIELEEGRQMRLLPGDGPNSAEAIR